jgi:hypothetical protein
LLNSWHEPDKQNKRDTGRKQTETRHSWPTFPVITPLTGQQKLASQPTMQKRNPKKAANSLNKSGKHAVEVDIHSRK